MLRERRPDCGMLIVHANGIGFEPGNANYARIGQLGLPGMQEWTEIEMLGGNLVNESSAGKGTTIVVEIPTHNS